VKGEGNPTMFEIENRKIHAKGNQTLSKTKLYFQYLLPDTTTNRTN